MLAYKAGGLRLFNVLTGVEETIAIATDATSYLTGARVSFVTIDKKTFICDGSTRGSHAARYRRCVDQGRALVQGHGRILQSGFEADLLAWHDSVLDEDKTLTITYNTGAGATYEDNTKLRTTYLAGKIRDACNANAEFTTYFDIAVADDCILITRKDAAKVVGLGVVTSDDSGNTDLTAVSSTGVSVSRASADGE